MVKPKGKGGRREGAGRKPRGDSPMGTSVRVLASEEWKEAITRLAEWDHAGSIAELVDRAIAHYARERGYPEPIPRR